MNDMLVLNNEYESWKNEIVNEIHSRQFRTVLNVNADTLQNYFEIGKKILDAQEEKGWGSHVIDQLSKDLEKESKCSFDVFLDSWAVVFISSTST